ncbi:MAG: hypothetical protein K2X77_29070 [Candidatus Obscuribacterales bacterium]|nr:hypothetical protein [Candidatus Obscuribacterales bacterium]
MQIYSESTQAAGGTSQNANPESKNSSAQDPNSRFRSSATSEVRWSSFLKKQQLKFIELLNSRHSFTSGKRVIQLTIWQLADKHAENPRSFVSTAVKGEGRVTLRKLESLSHVAHQYKIPGNVCEALNTVIDLWEMPGSIMEDYITDGVITFSEDGIV